MTLEQPEAFKAPLAPGEAPYFAPASKDKLYKFGVKLETSLTRNQVMRLVSLAYLELFKFSGIKNVRAVESARMELPLLAEHYPDLVPLFLTGLERFKGRIIIDDAYAVCAKCDDSIGENVAVTTWEGSRLPRFVAEGFKKFREVWVPSEAAQSALRDVSVPVYVIRPLVPVKSGPLPVRTPQLNLILFATEALRDEAFNVVRAYVERYTRADAVVLHVATPQVNWPPLKEFLKGLPPTAPFVTPVNIDLSNPEVAMTWFNQMDAAIVDSDGGWNIAEHWASAYGVPVYREIPLRLGRFGTSPRLTLKGIDDMALHARWEALGWSLGL